MNGADALRMAGTHLGRRKGRTVLTAAGVGVGVAALVLMVSLGLGVRRELLRTFSTEEEHRTIRVSRARKDAEGGTLGLLALPDLLSQMSPITDRDLEEIRRIPGVETARPELQMLLRLSVPGGRQESLIAGGLLPEEERRFSAFLTKGRIWGSTAERACLLPQEFLPSLGLKAESAVGQTLSLMPLMDEGDAEAYSCTVAGLFDGTRVGVTGQILVLPMERAIEVRDRFKVGSLLMAYRKGSYLMAEVRVSDPREAQAVRSRLMNSGYQAVSAADRIEAINLLFLIVEGFLACSGAIGLLVALFGIANTMATAVLERTREIGIMKALGALDSDIRKLFLMEAAAIGTAGGLAGLLLGFLGGRLFGAIARGMLKLGDIDLFHVSPWLAAGSVLFSIVVSVLAGLIPACRAGRLAPVEALRHE